MQTVTLAKWFLSPTIWNGSQMALNILYVITAMEGM
jgi:hypothetical protein